MKQLNLQNSQNKLRNKFYKLGVKMIGPETIYFSKDTKIGKNVTIEPYVVIASKVKIGNNVTIKSFSHLENCKIENKVEISKINTIYLCSFNLIDLSKQEVASVYFPNCSKVIPLLCQESGES